METLFFKESINLNNEINGALKEYDKAITYFEFDLMLESPEADSKTGKIKTALLNFIKRIKDAINNFINGAKKRIQKIVNGVKFKNDLSRVKKAVKRGQSVDFYDVNKFEKIYSKAARDLAKQCVSIQNKLENGCTVVEAELSIRKLTRTIDSYNLKLKDIKEKTIKMDAIEVLGWLESNYNNFGKPLGQMYYYQKTLEESEKVLNELTERTNKFYKDNNIDPAANAFTKAIGIATTFYRENSTWIIGKSCSSISSIFADVLAESDKKDIASKEEGTEEEKKAKAETKYNNPNYKSKKKDASKALKAAGTVGNHISDAIKNGQDGTGLEI